MDEQVVVMGAGFAGANAALRLSRRGFDVKVIDVKGTHEYTPGIIDVIRERVSENKLKRELHNLFDTENIEFTRERIESVDPDSRVVKTNAGSHNYDYLVVALGGEPNDFGMDVSEAISPYNLSEAKKVVEDLEDDDEVLIVGSGYVGIEFAGELSERGNEVTLVDQSTSPMSRSNEKASKIALDYLNKNNINFRGGQRVSEVNEQSVKLENGKKIEADKVLWSGGVRASEVVRESFDVESRGLPVDQNLQSPEYPKVFAAGDSADDDSVKTAHNSMRAGDLVGKNVGKSKSNMERYEGGEHSMIISMGDTAIFTKGDKAYEKKFFRKVKDMIRIFYWKQLSLSRVLS